jgi:hypothetical protein
MGRIDFAVSLFWFLLGLALCHQAVALGLGRPGGPGSGLFPLLAGLLMAAGGAGLMLRHVLTGGGPAPGEEIEERFWPAPGAAFRVAALIVAIVVMIFAVPWLGFAMAGVFGLPVLFRVIAPEAPWWKAILVGVVAATTVHLLFAVALGTPLPRGPLGF